MSEPPLQIYSTRIQMGGSPSHHKTDQEGRVADQPFHIPHLRGQGRHPGQVKQAGKGLPERGGWGAGARSVSRTKVCQDGLSSFFLQVGGKINGDHVVVVEQAPDFLEHGSPVLPSLPAEGDPA